MERETLIAGGRVEPVARTTIEPYDEGRPGPFFYQRYAHRVGAEVERVLGELDGGDALLFPSGTGATAPPPVMESRASRALSWLMAGPAAKVRRLYSTPPTSPPGAKPWWRGAQIPGRSERAGPFAFATAKTRTEIPFNCPTAEPRIRIRANLHERNFNHR